MNHFAKYFLVRFFIKGCLLITLQLLLVQLVSAQFVVNSQAPSPNSTSAGSSDDIRINFSQNVDESSLNGGIFVYGEISGKISGSFSLFSPNNVIFTPSIPFAEGEKVFVTVTRSVRATNGIRLAAPYQWSYHIQPLVGSFDFSGPIIYTLRSGSEPSGIIAADLSNNQAPDLIVVNSNNTIVTILENQTQNAGNFSIVNEIETGVNTQSSLMEEGDASFLTNLPSNSSLTAADLNNNGNTDIIITATLSNQLIILRNTNADPSNLELEVVDTGERPVEVISGDFNGNGYLDLAVASFGSDKVYLHFNDSNGNFGNPVAYSVGLAPVSISAEDINNNGRIDILVAISGENRIEALINQGAGVFTNTIVIDNLTFTPTFLITGNFVRENSNEYADIVLGSSDERIFYIFENLNGQFPLIASRTTGNASRPLSATYRDINSNGVLDLLTTHTNSDDLLISGFTNSTVFGAQIIVDNNVDAPLGITAADLNLGGSMDIAVTNSATNRVSVYFNQFDLEVCEGIISGFSVPSFVNFGTVELNTTSVGQFQIINNSQVSVDVTLEILTGNNFEITSPEEFSMAIGSRRTISVSFTPFERTEYSDQILVRVESVCGVQMFIINLLGEVGTPLPDLIASNLTTTGFESEFIIGVPYTFEGLLRLNGDVPVSSPFNTSFSVNGVVEEIIRINETIQAGQVRAYLFNYIFNQVGLNTITFIVDTDDEIEETDTTNNEISINIRAIEGQAMVSPNPFTPNNDGFNDSVNFNLTQLANISNPIIQIFSFNGRLVRTLRGEDFGREVIPWDGADENGMLLQPGVYLFVVQDNSNLIIRGAVTLAL